MGDLVKICGLYKKVKDGKVSLNGKPFEDDEGNFRAMLAQFKDAGSIRFLVLPNNYKKTDKHPDYNLFITENERRSNVEEIKTDVTI